MVEEGVVVVVVSVEATGWDCRCRRASAEDLDTSFSSVMVSPAKT